MMSMFKRHRYETPTVTVKVGVQDLMHKHFFEVQTMVSTLAAKMVNQEEDIKKLQQAVTVLDSKAEPSKVTLYTNGEVYKVIRHG